MEEEAQDTVDEATTQLAFARAMVNQRTLDKGLDKDGVQPQLYPTSTNPVTSSPTSTNPATSSHDSLVKFKEKHPLVNEHLWNIEEIDDDDNENGDNAYDVEGSIIDFQGLRQRAVSVERSWERARNIAQSNRPPTPKKSATQRKMSSGKWKFPIIREFLTRMGVSVIAKNKKVLNRAASKSGEIVDNVVGNYTYAVVTFTSRQGALAARQCLADGSGLNRWRELEDLPIPPLADAAPFNICSCRGICRPVTLTLNDNQRLIRKIM
jgi:hypothetical protein